MWSAVVTITVGWCQLLKCRNAAVRMYVVQGSLGLQGPKALRKIGVLSGGEKARVALAIFVMIPYNLLMLDEPSNHLGESTHRRPAAALVITYRAELISWGSNCCDVFWRRCITTRIVIDRTCCFLQLDGLCPSCCAL